MTYDSLSQVIRHVRQSSEWQADLTLVTGDLVQDDSREAYEHCARLLATLQMPVICIPGNHDVRPLMRDVLERWPISYCSSTEIGPWLIAGIDSCLDGSAGGRVSLPELRRLETVLRESAASYALVALHHQPVPVGTRWLDEVGLQNGEDFLRSTAKAGKSTVALFGHVHQAFDGKRNGIRILGTPSTCRQFRVGSDVFAVDDLPPAYRRLNLRASGGVDTEVIWIA